MSHTIIKSPKLWGGFFASKNALNPVLGLLMDSQKYILEPP